MKELVRARCALGVGDRNDVQEEVARLNPIVMVGKQRKQASNGNATTPQLHATINPRLMVLLHHVCLQ